MPEESGNITLEKVPAQFSLVGNPITVKIETTNRVLTEGTKAINKLTFTSKNAADGQSFTLQWKDYSVTITFSQNPDESGNEIGLAGSQTLEQFMSSVAAQMAANYYLSQFFDFSSDASSVSLTAKEVGTDYDLIYTAGLTPVTDMAFSITTPGEDLEYRENYKIALKVFSKTDTLLVHLGTDHLVPDDDGYCEFEISEYLQDLFKLKYQFPEPLIDGFERNILMYRRSGTVAPFQIQYCEMIDGVPQKLWRPGAIYYAMPGGVSSEDLKYYRLFQLDYYNYSGNDARFLTWCPDNKIINTTQSERLFFFTKAGISTIDRYGEITYTDGSKHDFNSIPADPEIPNNNEVFPYTIYEFLCGFKDLKLDLHEPTKTVKSYKIWLQDGATVISDVRTFIVNQIEYQNEKHFDFRTSFGGYDHARFTGEFIRNLETDRETATVTNKYFDNETLDQHISGRHVFKGNSGWLDRTSENAKEYLHYLNDFLLSSEIWEVKGMVRTRIRITSKKFVKNSTQKHLFSLKFNYEYVSEDQYHSNEINPLDDNYIYDEERLLMDEGRALTN